MKMKRLVATMLALLLVVSLLPIGAMAADDNTGTLDVLQPSETMNNNQGFIEVNLGSITNNGVEPAKGDPVDPNSGTVKTNYNNGKIENNYGTVNHNDGSSGNPQISENYGTVNTNSSGSNAARPNYNDGIAENYGLVQTNTSGGSIGTNAKGGTIENNSGSIGTNKKGGIIENNSGTVGSRNDDNEGTPDTSKGNHGEIYGNTGTVIFNDGTIRYNGAKVEKNAFGDVIMAEGTTNENATVVLNQRTIKENHGKVGTNEGTNDTKATIHRNYGTVDENKGLVEYNYTTSTYDPETGELIETPGVVTNAKGGEVMANYGTVNNGKGGVVNVNSGTVNNEKGGVVYENTGTVENKAGGWLNDVIVTKNPEKAEPDNYDYDYKYKRFEGEEGTYVATSVDRGYVKNEDGTTEEFQDGGIVGVVKQAIQGVKLNLKEVGNLFKQDGYEVIGYRTDFAEPAQNEDAADSDGVNETEYKVTGPNGVLKLIWGKIKAVVKPSGSSGDPEAKTVKKTVPTSLSGNQLKVGAYVRCGNMTFVIIEVTDTDIRVATANKLTEQDLADLLGCLKKHLSDAQIAKLIGEPELLEQELVNYFFGGRNEHIAFRAARDLFA